MVLLLTIHLEDLVHPDHPVHQGRQQAQDLTPRATPQVEATMVDILEQLSSLMVATLLLPIHTRDIPVTATTQAIELKTPSPRPPKDF